MMRRKEQLLEASLEQRGAGEEVTATSRRHHVATSPSHDVWSTNAEVNNSPRRDVNSKICIASLNARRLGNWGDWRTCGQRHGILEPATQTSRIFLDFCIGFSLLFDYFWIT